jgi:hypothetical protein
MRVIAQQPIGRLRAACDDGVHTPFQTAR